MENQRAESPTAHYHEGPEDVVEYVKEKAKSGNSDDILRVTDEYGWNVRGIMNVGDVKGKILDEIFQKADPTIVLELGSFIGYSAVRMARLLKPGGKIYSIEINPLHAKLTEEMVEFARLSDKVTVFVGPTEEVIPTLKSKHNIEHLDFVFIDHHKPLYKRDLIKLVETGLLRKGSVVVADNMLYPGNPEYMKFIQNHPKFESQFFESQLEYSTEVADGMMKSVYLG
ncbi:catechol O-methyltransferase-like [Styela clava]